MGLTKNFKSYEINKKKNNNGSINLALLGNPNVGKSTLFNLLTGLNQHTGNWPGKTVSNAIGKFKFRNKSYNIIDLPGTYSLNGYSQEEQIAVDYLINDKPDITVIVVDATSIERNLNLVLEAKTKVDNIVVCINLIDEARLNGIEINFKKLEKLLKVPVIEISARKKIGINNLLNLIYHFKGNSFEKEDLTILEIQNNANCIFNQTVEDRNGYSKKTLKIDSIVTSKKYGILIMLVTLGIILWITIIGANYISEYLSVLLFNLLDLINSWLSNTFLSSSFVDFVVNGILKTVFWVVSVMLPPMAIFFPLFALLEDSGYLPRIAFNTDKMFSKCGAHGKQSLTMCMGYGCNACGVIGCRIIESKREKLIAILTNAFSPCNGRFPSIIATISIFITVGISNRLVNSFISALFLLGFIVLSIFMTFLVSKILSKTILKGISSSFSLELPPYRKPEVVKTIIRSIIDRTLFVLSRAIVVSIPAGIVIWVCANTFIGDYSILTHCSNFLDGFAYYIGLDGVILLAFIFGLPANEIVVPIIIMAYLATGNITGYNSLEELKTLLVNNGWSIITAINFILFTMFHFPCGTTILTIKKETNSFKWTFLSIVIPTLVGLITCFLFTSFIRLLV